MSVSRPLAAFAVLVCLLAPTGNALAQAGSAYVSPELLRQAADDERGRAPDIGVIVNFETPGSRDVVPQPAAVRSAREQVLARLPTASFQQVASFDRIRAVSLKVNAESLEILKRTPGVVAINSDRVVRTNMIQANALTGVATLHGTGFTGEGQVVAIIDTGVDSNAGVVHPGLADDLVGQACFRTENDCIGGATSAEDQEGHGTHVAGMITGPNGVAPDAQFHALKVFTTGSTSDTNILNALNHVIGLNTTTPGAVDLINMSLGGDNYADSASCDAAGVAYVNAFATLNGQGTSIFVATGNDAETGRIGSPGCITGAIGVGSTGDATFTIGFGSCTDNGAPDKVSCYSNATPVQGAGELVDLLAPGCDIISTGLNGSTTVANCGTSMATPYAAGAAALVLEFLQGEGLSYTPAQLEDVLEYTGKPVLDYRIPGSPQFPRVDPVATVGALSFAAPPSNFTITATTTTSFSMSWTGIPEATQYRVYRNVAGSAPVQVGTTTAPTVTFTDNSAICGAQTYFVRAFDGTALSLPSNEDTDTARACPLTPTSLVATPVSSTAVTLSWTDANADETAQILQRGLNGGAFADYQTLAAGTSLSFNETALPCGVYQYRAIAERNGDRSLPSNVVQFAACAPANDNFVNAENIVADVAITDVEANVSFASEEVADPVYSCKFGGAGPGAQGIWYRITPGVATRVTVSTAATTLVVPVTSAPDTLAAIYTHNGSAFTEIACNDDISGSNFRSSVSSNLAAGTTYYVFISQWGPVAPGTVGNVSAAFTWSAQQVAPDNDLVANARVISAMPYNNTVINAQFATTSATDLTHGCAFGGARLGTHTLWWTFTPATNGLLDIDTLASSGSFTDTLMTVYSGTPGNFTVVGCNDDEPAPGTTLRSEILDLALTGGTQYTIYISRWNNTPTATAGTVVLNASFQPTAGPPAQLAIGTQPGNTVAGVALTPAVTVNILDAFGVQTNSTANVTLAIGANPGTGSLSGTTTVAAVNGVASFSGLSIDKVGTGYTLVASSPSLTGATSNTFNISPAAPAQLAFVQQPTNTAGGAAINPAITVQALDAFGNLTGYTGNITLAIGSNPTGGTLSGTTTVAAVGGVATFSGLSINTAGNGYTLAASSPGLTAATSSAFNITVGAPAQLAFGQQPSNTAGGAAITPAPTVRILDAGGNLTSSTANVTLAIANNPVGGTLSGTSTVAAVAGVATFPGLSINTAGNGYTLGASSSALTGATSGAFNIVVGAPAQLAFGQQPTNTAGGAAITPAPTVRLLDAGGNLTGSTANVSVSIGTNPAGGTLSGTTTVAAVAGVATFPGLSINTAGNGYALAAGSAGLSGTTSSVFNITVGAAAQLAFGQQPTNAAANTTIAPAPTVRILDAGGNLTASTASVAMAIGSNPGTSTLGGTTSVAAVAGIATFSDLTLNNGGNGYTLTAASAGLTGTTSSAFNINCPPTVVTNSNDSGAGSLRQIIADACAGSTITFAGGVTASNLTSAELLINKNLTIDGGAGVTVNRVAGSPDFRIFNVSGAATTVVLDSLTISGGSTAGAGGGILNAGVLTVLDSTITGNASTAGASGGGGIQNTGTLTVDNTAITNNSASWSGGGIAQINGGSMVLSNCLLANNSTPRDGGALTSQSLGANNASASITNCTISGNSGGTFAGAILNIGFTAGTTAQMQLTNNTIVGNSNPSQGAVLNAVNAGAATLQTRNNVFANNTPSNVGTLGAAVTTSLGNNLSSDATGGGGPGDLISTNPQLAALGNYGGPTQTHALLPGSPAINAGSDNSELQAIAVSGASGTFTLTFNGQTTSALAFNATAAAVDAQMEALSTVGAGNVVVTAVTGGYWVRFQGTLAGANQPQTVGSGAGGAVVTVSTLVNGAAAGTDQRGIARPQLGAVDIGAYESRGFTLAVTGGNNQSVGPGLVFPASLALTVTPIAAGEPVNGGVVTFTPPGAGASASLAPNPVTIAGGSASTVATANTTVGSYTVGANAIGAAAPANFTLTNAAADISIDDVTVTEGNAGTSNVVFTVTRTNSLTDFIVPYSITPATAQAGSDYTTTSGTLQFVAGGPLTRTISVPVVGDLIVEATETASLNLGAVINVVGVTTIVDGSGLLTISDNDVAVVAFNPVSVSQTEATTPMAFTVTLSNPVQSGVTLSLNSVFGTALAADFTPIVGGTVSFPANSNANQTVNVVINNDALDEDDESFTLALTGLTAVGNVSSGVMNATGTILDDDPTPSISVTSPSQPEGNAGNTAMNFVVSLSAISGRDVTFTRATADGTATTANSDYQPLAPQLITIPAGQLSTTIAVQIVGDTTYEGNESFSLNLSGVSNATPASISGTGTLVDDDQQPTTTTITSDTPDPTVVGQPYTVAVTVAAVTSTPLGTVTISDGSASCGPVTLTTAAAPNSTASCALTSTSAGAKTLTASYTPASTAFAASSGTTAHQVNAASTAISVVGPARSRINQPTTFTFALSVNAPGAGAPAGTVTLSSGTATCSVTVPTLTPSCALSFDTLGPRTITAAFAPSDGNFLASSSSGAGNAQTLVYAQSDIAVTKTDVVGTYRPGDLLVYTVTVRNLGPDAAAVIRVRDQVPAGVVNVNWTCDASGGVACPAASGSGNLDVTVAAFPVGGLLNFSFFGNVSGSPAQIVNTALVELPADTTIEDPNLSNNSASDTDLLEFLFRNGFEDPQVSAPAGSYRLPSLGLRGVLDEAARVVYVLDDANGEALRVYARLFDGQVQYALAGRNGIGELRLAAWRSYAGEPTLSWTARQVGEGWVLATAEIR